MAESQSVVESEKTRVKRAEGGDRGEHDWAGVALDGAGDQEEAGEDGAGGGRCVEDAEPGGAEV